jgi:hypothetical protein
MLSVHVVTPCSSVHRYSMTIRETGEREPGSGDAAGAPAGGAAGGGGGGGAAGGFGIHTQTYGAYTPSPRSSYRPVGNSTTLGIEDAATGG